MASHKPTTATAGERVSESGGTKAPPEPFADNGDNGDNGVTVHPARGRVRIVVATEMLMVLGLLAFVSAAYLVELAFEDATAVRLPAVAAGLLAAVPALLWLGYFYVQDRHEPEPKQYVLGLYLLGAFVAAPVAGFAIAQVVPSSSILTPGLDPLGADRIVYALLIVAVAQELSKYAVVRYTMYPSAEFDEPLDGIIYATAVGIGFATHENYRFLQESGGEILLSAGAAHAVVNTLAHACFAAVAGYALGRAKFVAGTPARRTLTLIVGLGAAVALNGQFRLIADTVVSQGMSLRPWRGVAFTFGFTSVVFLVVSIMVRRLLFISPHAKTDDEPPDVEPPPDAATASTVS